MFRLRLTTRIITEAGMMLALATVLSLLKVWSMPTGGSVTAGSMIPIIILAMLRGPVVGITVGIVHGMLQYLLEGWFVTPLQVLLDYPLAFGTLGVAGFFWLPRLRRGLGVWVEKHILPILAVLFAISLRFLAHFISGIIYWSDLAPEGTPAWLYSLTYNASYLVPEFVITGILAWMLVPVLTKYIQRS